ncbi:lysine acetyltransferase [Naviculisporaceae sp. PSN 640]
MGSTTNPPSSSMDNYNPPDASSPSLVLVEPTHAERLRVWTMTHPKWGAALTLDNYLGREVYLQTVPLAKEGGLTSWILTDRSLPPDERPILSSCESLRKRAIAASSDSSGEIVDGIAHGIASVFTEPQFRGKGYASRMMKEVGEVLKDWQAGDKTQGALFSVLYSDIGKKFYAKNGWAPYPSSHVSFKPAIGTAGGDVNGTVNGKTLTAAAKPIGYHELAELCCADEALLKKRAREVVTIGGKKSAAAILPSLEQLLWHMMREDYMTKHIFGKTPDVRGAVYGEKGKRIWAIWSRGYYGGLETIKGNTFHILRFVIEDEEGMEEEEMVKGFGEIVKIAQREAGEWRSEDIQMWNPGETTRRLIEKSGVEYKIVEREEDSIASLRWYGEGELEEWVGNEKYAWC